MDYARLAMERVPLNHSTAAEPSKPTIPQPSADEQSSTMEDGPSFLLPLTKRIHRFFRTVCQTAGWLFLNLISALMLFGGIVGGVALQMLSFYYTGVLNVYFLIACILYAPTLAGMAIIRGHLVHHGTTPSSSAPRMTHMVALAYLAILLCGICSLLQPVLMRMEGVLSGKGMWISIAGTGVLYYCLLVSEVLFATAVNVRKARDVDEELVRREREDPEWITGYQAIHSAEEV